MTPRIARVDANQEAIVSALRAAGARVQHLHTLGRGCPDILVAFRGRWYVAELKSAQGQLTPDEVRWHQKFSPQGPVYIWRSRRQALCDIGAIEWEDDA